MSNYTYIYLHGFASHPNSLKAQYFKQKMEQDKKDLIIPDLNMGDFSSLTLTRQINQVEELIRTSTKPIIMFGSSMGGLTAALLAEKHYKIEKMVLFAPAFSMSQLWKENPLKELQQWQENGSIEVIHYGYKKKKSIKYEFYLDLFKHDDTNFKRELKALIFHGINDEVVPIENSRNYQKSNPLAQLIELNDDHNLGRDLNDMWLKINDFCND